MKNVHTNTSTAPRFSLHFKRLTLL